MLRRFLRRAAPVLLLLAGLASAGSRRKHEIPDSPSEPAWPKEGEKLVSASSVWAILALPHYAKPELGNDIQASGKSSLQFGLSGARYFTLHEEAEPGSDRLVLTSRDGRFPDAIKAIHSRVWANVSFEPCPASAGAPWSFTKYGTHPCDQTTMLVLQLPPGSSHNLAPFDGPSDGRVHWFGGDAKVVPTST